MPDLLKVNYAQSGKSTNTDALGMREMQARAYAARDAQYLLLKSPPASGKSRALMFIGLDKLRNQGLKKVIVAVPERSIGSSFAPTELKKFGFFEDWRPENRYNLCTPGGDGSKSKVKAFLKFLDSEAEILICTHATLRFAYLELEEEKLNNTLLAIDEFHHVSADGDNRLGELLRSVMENSTAHIVAMTGSYFRGDSVPVLLPEDEAKFTKVTYNYYEQLNGYEYLKSLGIGYHFYQGKYLNALPEILDTNRKTILHIPNVNSGESTKEKYDEVGFILDIIGEVEEHDFETGVITVKRKDGKLLKVADLVNDTPSERNKIVNYLRSVDSPEDMDIIIALGMAKEGFDWKFCEHALTVGYRGSLTEVVQIIGRATRDSQNKTHAQFTNLIAQPDAEDERVTRAVNDMLKAITASLLMEQVLAPSFKFKPRPLGDDEPAKGGEIKIRGFKKPTSKRVEEILESDITDLKATILQDTEMQKTISGNVDPEVINKVIIPKIIRVKYPDLNEDEVEEIRQNVVVDTVTRSATIEQTGDKRFIRMADKFVNIDDLHIDLIDSINPFHNAYEIMSKSVDAPTLRLIQEAISSTRIKMTQEEAMILYPKIAQFKNEKGRLPDINAFDPLEKRMAEALIYLKELKRKKMSNG